MQEQPKLKNCPFCDDKVTITEIRWISQEAFNIFHPQNSICPLSNKIICSHIEKNMAIGYWNLRASTTAPGEKLIPFEVDKVTHYLYAVSDGLYTMDNAKEVAINLNKKFGTPNCTCKNELNEVLDALERLYNDGDIKTYSEALNKASKVLKKHGRG